jgi:hypothetical protein
MIVGGIHERTFFHSVDPVNSSHQRMTASYIRLNFWLGACQRTCSLGILKISLYNDKILMSSFFALPDRRVLMIASNQTIIYDIEKNPATTLPDIPNDVRVTNPFDGTATFPSAPYTRSPRLRRNNSQ